MKKKILFVAGGVGAAPVYPQVKWLHNHGVEADVIVGSLIKNLGGGIASNGAYIAGRSDLIDLCGERLTLPGEGREVGPTLGINKQIL